MKPINRLSEDGKVTISRASGTKTFLVRFMLVAAMNPCRCGYFGDPKRERRCGSRQVLGAKPESS